MNTVSEFTVRRSFLRLRHSTSLRLHPEAGRDSIFFGWTVLAPDWRGLIPNSPLGRNYRNGTGRVPVSGKASPFFRFGGAPAVSRIEETPAPYAAGTGLTRVLAANQCSKNPGSSPPGGARILSLRRSIDSQPQSSGALLHRLSSSFSRSLQPRACRDSIFF